MENKSLYYDGNMLIIWAILGGGMIYLAPSFFYSSVEIGVLFLVVSFFIGYMIESFLLRRVNKKYNINGFTHSQKIIAYSYMMLTLLSIILTTIYFNIKVESLIYPTWIFVIGFSGVIAGLLIKCKTHFIISQTIVLIAILMFLYIAFNLEMANDKSFVEFGKWVAIFTLVPSYIYLGFYMKNKI